jgi:hypothetical protein
MTSTHNSSTPSPNTGLTPFDAEAQAHRELGLDPSVEKIRKFQEKLKRQKWEQALAEEQSLIARIKSYFRDKL